MQASNSCFVFLAKASKTHSVNRKEATHPNVLMEQAPTILVMERLDALWETSAQALDVTVFVDFFTTPFQPTPVFFPTFFPALHWCCPLKALAKPRHRRLVQNNVLQAVRLLSRVVAHKCGEPVLLDQGGSKSHK